MKKKIIDGVEYVVRDGYTEEDIFNEEIWSSLGEEEGRGSYCCGKRMVEIMTTFTCLKCGHWEYSDS